MSFSSDEKVRDSNNEVRKNRDTDLAVSHRLGLSYPVLNANEFGPDLTILDFFLVFD